MSWWESELMSGEKGRNGEMWKQNWQYLSSDWKMGLTYLCPILPSLSYPFTALVHFHLCFIQLPALAWALCAMLAAQMSLLWRRWLSSSCWRLGSIVWRLLRLMQFWNSFAYRMYSMIPGWLNIKYKYFWIPKRLFIPVARCYLSYLERPTNPVFMCGSVQCRDELWLFKGERTLKPYAKTLLRNIVSS